MLNIPGIYFWLFSNCLFSALHGSWTGWCSWSLYLSLKVLSYGLLLWPDLHSLSSNFRAVLKDVCWRMVWCSYTHSVKVFGVHRVLFWAWRFSSAPSYLVFSLYFHYITVINFHSLFRNDWIYSLMCLGRCKFKVLALLPMLWVLICNVMHMIHHNVL